MKPSLQSTLAQWLKNSRMTSIVIVCILMIQAITHLGWLSISTQSAQMTVPWLMNHGWTLFDNLIENRTPGSAVLLAAIQRISPVEPIMTVRALNLAVVLLLTVLVYVVAWRFHSRTAGVLAALIWFWWEPVYGNVLFYFDSLLGCFLCLALASFVLLKNVRALFCAGFFMGAATLSKQQAWVAVLIFCVYVAVLYRRKALIFIGGVLILLFITVLIVAAQGNLQSYLYWNWEFNLSGLMDGAQPTADFIRKVILSNSFVPVFALLVLQQRKRKQWLLLLLLWIASTITLLPRFGLVHAMAQLPLSAIMSGVVLGLLFTAVQGHWRLSALENMSLYELTLSGLLSALLIGWVWTGLVSYIPTSDGVRIPAYEEFLPLTARLRELARPDDTLFVLPELDSTPQIHSMSELLPPGLWIKEWRWYLEAPGIVGQLLTDWRTTPPEWIVVFPQLLEVGQPEIQPLVDFVYRNYTPVEHIDDVIFHGDAVIYRLSLP